ncbi:hypothetical protein PFTANZ_05972, partial [Plasmodium falciparum Tanzania (2000708)]
KYPDCGKNEKYDPPTDVTPTDINVLYSGDEHGDIAKRLSTFCRDSNKENEKNYQEWKCYYNGESDNKCQMQKVLENKVQTKITTFDFFFDLWIKNLLRDTINWKSELKNCINNKNTEKCNKDCNENCKCFEKWVNQKEKEWNNMKELFKNKKGTSQNYYNKLNNHFQGYFFQVTNEVNKDEAKWNQFTEELRKKMDFSKANTGTNDSQDAIKVLLEHLKEDGKTCTANNPDSACNKPQADRIITPATTRNPCVSGGNASVGKITSVRRVAKRMQKQASVRHDGDISKLKADAKLGEYSKRNVERTLNTECDITLEHSNRDPKRSDGPCAGKNQGRFNIGENWKTGGTVSSKDHVFLPPRREHMCTSNLEYLQTNISPLNGSDGSVKGRSKINDSFLGDVLLSAKSEADFIKKKYKRQKASNGFMDEATICRAMKYSFADIGDIIRGRDLWERNGDMVKLQGHLKTIFGHINKSLKKTLNGNTKYEKDGEPYTKLREDWWEANRDQVWKAMQCPTTTKPAVIIIKCGTDTPLMDYIPQRLRWMMEWAEWYCKAQSKYYGDLVSACGKCQEKKTECTQGTDDCEQCKGACSKYETFIKDWGVQWKQMEQKYKDLYGKAKIAANGDETVVPNGHTTDKDQQVVNFLKLLIPRSDKSGSKSGNTPYSTAGGYIHETADVNNCNTQKVFCNTTSKDNYAFQLTPKGYEQECMCEKRPKAPQKKPEVPKVKPPTSACDIVKKLLDGKGETSSIYGCNIKSDVNWECEKNIDPKHAGACMPPRRQKLCIYYFGNPNETRKIQTQAKLREEFIKSAAGETFLSWQKYKTDNKSDANLQNKLESGIIPEDFKRKMFYTFGDLRDFLFGTDISKNH